MSKLSMLPEKTSHTNVVKEMKTTYLKNKVNILLNNWCVQKINNEYTFFKHIQSDRKGVIHQVILSGNEYDGVYELEIFGHGLTFENKVVDREAIMKINTNSNYDLAQFTKESHCETLEMRDNDINVFKEEFLKYNAKLSSYDVLKIYLKNKETITLNKKQIGEIRLKKQLRTLLRDNIIDIDKIKFYQKKRDLYLYREELGSIQFKEELIAKGYVTEEEYDLYTTQKEEICKNLYKSLKKVEII